MGIFGSSGSSTSSVQPWTMAQPALTQIINHGQSLNRRKVGFNAPKFSTAAKQSAQTAHALSGMYGAAQGPNPLAGMSENAISGILGGATNDKYNQLFANADNTHFANAVQNQSDQIANDVQRQFSGLGRVGSAADSGALVDQIGRFREQALSDNWNQNIANQRGILGDQSQGQLSAVAAAPGAYDQRFAPYRIQGQVGSAIDANNQRMRDAQTNRFNTNQSAPWNRLNAQLGLTTGAGTGYGTTSQTSQDPSNPFGGALGGALGGASLFKGSPFMGAGAIGGGLLGLLSGL